MIARLCPAGMIFVPSVGGLSHNVREDTRPEQLAAGAAVLRNAVLRRAAERTLLKLRLGRARRTRWRNDTPNSTRCATSRSRQAEKTVNLSFYRAVRFVFLTVRCSTSLRTRSRFFWTVS
jgi:hypothetical protein